MSAAERTSFREVADEIVRRITGGAWGPGTLLPGEVELARDFGCSRATINRAMGEVAALGLVERRRKAGTRVRPSPLRQARFDMPPIRAEVEAAGAAYRYALIRRETAPLPDWLRSRLGVGGGEGVHVVCVHHADGRPFQLEDRWINAAALPQALARDFADSGPGEWLVATVPFSEVDLSFAAERAGELAATHLGCAPADPLFVVERTTWWQSAPITHVRLCYRPGYRKTARY